MKKLNLLLLMLAAALLLPLAGCGHDDEPDRYANEYKDLTSFQGPIEGYYYSAIITEPVLENDKYVHAQIIEVHDVQTGQAVNVHNENNMFAGPRAGYCHFRKSDLPNQDYKQDDTVITFKIGGWKIWQPSGVSNGLMSYYSLIVEPYNK